MSENFAHMKLIILIVTSLLVACTSQSLRNPGQATNGLSIERIFQDPNLDGPSPRHLKFSPDGARVTYLKEKLSDHKKLDLWEYNLHDNQNRLLVDSSQFLKGEENLSAEEKARRERMRISDSGIVEYTWTESGKAIVFPLAGALFYYPIGQVGATARRLTDGSGHETDAHPSHNGKYVSFVRNQNLFYVDTKSAKEHQLTSDGKGTIKNGIAEFIAQEEMDRFDGQWWSNDEKKLAFTRTDESGVEIEKRYEINANGFEVTDERYPRAGTKNVKIKLGVATIGGESNQIKWLDLGKDPDIYLARAQWLPDNKTLAVQIESRNQKQLDLVFFNTETGERRSIISEQSEHWINLHDDLRFTKSSGQFVWTSERSGNKHIYIYNLKGELLRTLTTGEWPVHDVLEFDRDEKSIYFTGSRETPLEQNLYRVPLSGGPVVQISQEKGWHRISMPASAGHYIDTFSSVMKPASVSIHSADGRISQVIEENKVAGAHPLAQYIKDFSPPEFGSFESKDGTMLYYRLTKPKYFKDGHRYPLIVDVYGGPGHQNVRDAWLGRTTYIDQIWASRGYMVLSLDNRGSWGRDRKFTDAIYHQLGSVEVEDQAAGVEWLTKQGLVDPAKVGVFGWSYGGYMTLMMLMQRPDVFKVGVSVAPVTDWTLYDTHYTERFMGTPAKNKQGYKMSNVLQYVDQLQGKLLMMHGMADDNVLFTNSTKVYKALQDRSALFEMMNYPGSKHGISGEKLQTHVYKTMTEFFDRNLSSTN